MRPVAELVEYIRKLCKSRGTSLTKLEEELNFANGTIGKWGKRNNRYPSYDKLQMIASALDVPVSALTGEEEKIPATQMGSGEDEVTDQLLSFLRSATPEEQKEIANYIEFIKSKRGNK